MHRRHQLTQIRTTHGVILLIIGFLCHVFAAQAIGGTARAYRDHVLGFVLLTVVSAVIVLFLGKRFWKGRPEVSWLIVGILQAAIGVWVWMGRYNVHG
jgi:hypothetical protein